MTGTKEFCSFQSNLDDKPVVSDAIATERTSAKMHTKNRISLHCNEHGGGMLRYLVRGNEPFQPLAGIPKSNSSGNRDRLRRCSTRKIAALKLLRLDIVNASQSNRIETFQWQRFSAMRASREAFQPMPASSLAMRLQTTFRLMLSS